MIPGGSPIGSDSSLHGLLCTNSTSLYFFREHCLTFVALLSIFNHAIVRYPPNSSLVFQLFTVSFTSLKTLSLSVSRKCHQFDHPLVPSPLFNIFLVKESLKYLAFQSNMLYFCVFFLSNGVN